MLSEKFYTQWYAEKYGEKWTEEHALNIQILRKCMSEYEKYCKDKNIKPVWNG